MVLVRSHIRITESTVQFLSHSSGEAANRSLKAEVVSVNLVRGNIWCKIINLHK